MKLTSMSRTLLRRTASAADGLPDRLGSRPAIPTSDSRRGLLVLVTAIGVVVVLVIGAILLGSAFRTPEQAAADAAPPEPSLITVPAELRVLSQPVVLRGRVMAGESQQIRPPTPAIGLNAVVTSVPVKSGQTIGEGSVLVAVAGQPIFVLSLAFPLYRDLVGGVRGPDVAEVQRALRRLGYRVKVTSKYDWPTMNAVGRLYRDRGFEPKPGKAAAVDNLPAARDAVEQAQADLDAAMAAGEGVEAATAALDAAKRTLAAMEVEAGPGLAQSSVVRFSGGGTVTAVKVAVGDVLTDPETILFEVNGGEPYLLVGASRDQAALISAGQQATIVDEATGRTTTAKVDQVATEPNSDPSLGLTGFAVRLSFTGEAMQPVADRTVRVDIAAASGDTPVLAVPVTAVYSRADATTFVTVLREDGETEDITVTTGRVAGGWVEVTARDNQLKPDDSVVVGLGEGS